MEKMPITKAGFEKLKKELDQLKRVLIPENIKAIEEARGHGDISENAEYQYAKERQSFLHGRQQEIENCLATSQIIFSLAFWAKTYLELLPGTFLISWFYIRSKGSILVAGIVHAAANTTCAFFPNLDWTVYDLTVAVAALVIILADRMWEKLPSDHRAVHQKPAVKD